MPFEIVRNNIVNMQVDAIVNSANPNLVIGSGFDSEIYEKAGNELLVARQNIGTIKFGDARITPGFGLGAKYIIHTVGPIWEDGTHGEKLILSSSYRKCLALAKEYKCESIAFPLISTGNDGFPKPLALQIAINEISMFLLENDMHIYLVVFDRDAFVLSEKLFKSVNSYIDENYIQSKTLDEYGMENVYESNHLHQHLKQRNRIDDDRDISLSLQTSLTMDDVDWEQVLDDLDAGFSETLMRLIDRSGKKDSEIYKKANVDRKLFSKIKNNIDYRPSKSTALAFAFALELDIDETKDFISRAGFVPYLKVVNLMSLWNIS